MVYDWNHIFTEEEDAGAWFDPDVHRMFVEAINERLTALPGLRNPIPLELLDGQFLLRWNDRNATHAWDRTNQRIVRRASFAEANPFSATILGLSRATGSRVFWHARWDVLGEEVSGGVNDEFVVAERSPSSTYFSAGEKVYLVKSLDGYRQAYKVSDPPLVAVSWPALMNLVVELSDWFIRPGENYSGRSPEDYARQGSYPFYPPGVQGPLVGATPRSLPYFYWPRRGMFTRDREREITSLSCPGESGQVARFIRSDRGQFADGYSPARATSPSAPLHEWPPPRTEPFTMPATPAAEFEFSRKIMRHDGTTWAVDDTGSEPDTLEFFGFPAAGDRVGVHFLNELRDAINDLVEMPWNPTLTTLPASAEWFYPERSIYRYVLISRTVGTRTVTQTFTQDQQPSVFHPTVCQRAVDFYVLTDLPEAVLTVFGSGWLTTWSEFHDQGFEYAKYQTSPSASPLMTLVTSVGATSEHTVTSDVRVGDAGRSPIPVSPDNLPSGEPKRLWGWQGSIFTILKFNVPGGFKYVRSN